MKNKKTAYRSLLIPMMQDAIKGLGYAIEKRGLADDPDFREPLGYAKGVLDQIEVEMDVAPEFVPDEEIGAMYKSGLSLEDVAAKAGCSVSKVLNTLKALGIRTRRRGPGVGSTTERMRTLHPERTADMIAMRKRGATLQEIGAKYKITRERVRQILIREGVDTTVRPVSPEDLAIVKEYLDGDSLFVVAERHKITTGMLKKMITRAGYKVRPSNRMKAQETKKKAELAAKLYREGMRTKDIAERLGYGAKSGAAIYRLLAIAGIRPERIARRTPRTERCEPPPPTKRAEWTPENIDHLKRLWNNGCSAGQIATLMGGISRNAVLGQVHRLGIARNAIR